MRFGKWMGILGVINMRLRKVIGSHLYDVWEVYGDPMGVISCERPEWNFTETEPEPKLNTETID